MLQSNLNLETGVVESMTEKEKEALRLLLMGHNAKSIAQELNLSVHTVNERFRSARQKLRVTSSREAARILGIHEKTIPENLVPSDFGVAASNESSNEFVPQQPRPGVATWLPRLIGVSFMITAIAAAMMFTLAPASLELSNGEQAQQSVRTADSEAVKVASNWLELIDAQKHEESRSAASEWMQSQMSVLLWHDMVDRMREGFGQLQSRTPIRVTRTGEMHNSNIPNANYAIVEFNSRFEIGPEIKETVVLVRESGDLRPIEYFLD